MHTFIYSMKGENQMITGKQFKEIREYKGLSLRDVAKFCNISPQLIGQIEQGKKSFTKNNYQQIIDALNLVSAAEQRGEFIKEKGKKTILNNK